MKGTIKSLRNGYGFISLKETETEKDIDVFFYHAELLQGIQFNTLKEGQEVEVEEIVDGEKGKSAKGVMVIEKR